MTSYPLTLTSTNPTTRTNTQFTLVYFPCWLSKVKKKEKGNTSGSLSSSSFNSHPHKRQDQRRQLDRRPHSLKLLAEQRLQHCNSTHIIPFTTRPPQPLISSTRRICFYTVPHNLHLQAISHETRSTRPFLATAATPRPTFDTQTLPKRLFCTSTHQIVQGLYDRPLTSQYGAHCPPAENTIRCVPLDPFFNLLFFFLIFLFPSIVLRQRKDLLGLTACCSHQFIFKSS